jgi:hypothetical protein
LFFFFFVCVLLVCGCLVVYIAPFGFDTRVKSSAQRCSRYYTPPVTKRAEITPVQKNASAVCAGSETKPENPPPKNSTRPAVSRSLKTFFSFFTRASKRKNRKE